jgi:hypothetical protein
MPPVCGDIAMFIALEVSGFAGVGLVAATRELPSNFGVVSVHHSGRKIWRKNR